MDIPFTDPNAIGYWIDNPIQKEFLEKPKFCLFLQEYLQKLLSTKIAITLQRPPPINNKWRSTKQLPTGYMIQLLDTTVNKTEMKKAVSDFCKKYFDTIQSKSFNDDKVKQWLQYSLALGSKFKLQCIQNIMDERVYHVFTVCESVQKTLKIYYLMKKPFSVSDSKELDQIIEKEIVQEAILLPSPNEQSEELQNELEKIEAKAEAKSDVYLTFVNSALNKMQTEVILFGYYKTVNKLKEELLKMIAKNNVQKFKFNSITTFQIDFLLKNCSDALQEIAEKYNKFGVDLRLNLNEFSAPPHLKDEIESCIAQLLSQYADATFKSIQLSKDVAERAEKHLQYIANKSGCCVKIELKYKFQTYTIPKASSFNKQVSKSVVEQSDHFLSSSNVFNRIVVGNGSIEIFTGDIAEQKVDTIVILNTPDGLKEGVIERAGSFDYEHTYADTTGTKFTETNGGNLYCKQILFSNWTPLTIANDDNELRKSIQVFMSKSIEYATKNENCTSIAFAVSDSCTNETILAQEMVAEAKQQLESRKLELKISFVLLSEQQILRNQFFAIISAMQDIYAQFQWPTAVVKTMLIASEAENLTKCQEKMNNYLKRCSTSSKTTKPNGIFQHWDQYSINAFYKYCTDECVLPQINKTKREIELIGPINNVLQVKQKLSFLSELAIEKASRTQATQQRPSSAAMRSARLDIGTTIGQAKVYNIMLSYSERDIRVCQRLINHLIEEGFSIWAEPVITGQQRDASSQIEKSDCVILCISENYYESESCAKEAKYAFQTSKQVFSVKVQNHPLIGWQREVFEEKLFFQLFGSENHFVLGYGNLLLEILRYTKPGYVSLLQQRSGRTQQDNDDSQSLLTVEQRRSIYDKKIETLIEVGRIDEKEMENLIQQAQNIFTEPDQDESAPNEDNESNNNEHRTNQILPESFDWIQRWLRKPTKNTKQNLPPFSASGDINDALFPMPDFIMNHLDQHGQSLSLTRSSPVKFRNTFESDIILRPTEEFFKCVLFSQIPVADECIYGIRTQKLKAFDGLSQNIFNRHSIVDSVSRQATGLPLVSLESHSMQKRRELDNSNRIEDAREEIDKQAIKKYERPTREKLNVYLKKFAQRMEENAAEFERFCSINAAVA